MRTEGLKRSGLPDRLRMNTSLDEIALVARELNPFKLNREAIVTFDVNLERRLT